MNVASSPFSFLMPSILRTIHCLRRPYHIAPLLSTHFSFIFLPLSFLFPPLSSPFPSPGNRSALVLAALFLAANANHDAGVSDPNGADQPNLCPGDKCDCKYNCKKKCHCNGWHRGGRLKLCRN